MFRQILFTQWRWSAPVVALLGILAVALPIAAFNDMPTAPGEILYRSAIWGFLYPALAALTGLLIGISAWTPDHRGGHVYALTLPVPRWLYALLRYGAGVVLILAVTAAVLVGALIATSWMSLPPGFQANTGIVTLRFVLGAILVFSVIFAIGSGTTRTAGIILGGLAGLVLAQLIAGRISPGARIIEPMAIFLVGSEGPFGVFATSWLLVGI